jgi:hypothetical protein
MVSLVITLFQHKVIEDCQPDVILELIKWQKYCHLVSTIFKSIEQLCII